MAWNDFLTEFKEPQRLTDEELELLIRDVSARIPYGVKAQFEVDWENDDPDKPICHDFIVTAVDRRHNNLFWAGGVQLQEAGMPNGTMEVAPRNETFKPYLRSFAKMSHQEYKVYWHMLDINESAWTVMDWLNSHHLDYNRLIEKGLALEAPEGMYNIEGV